MSDKMIQKLFRIKSVLFQCVFRHRELARKNRNVINVVLHKFVSCKLKSRHHKNPYCHESHFNKYSP